jgi:predicted transcriptional regulator
VNIILGIFNLVPGFPLDGGRVLRAFLWAVTHDLEKATRWASYSGQLVAWTMIALGVTSMFGGNVGQGIWLMLIGWFLLHAARASYQQTMIEEALRGARVREVMRRGLTSVPPELPVSSLVTDYLMSTDQQAFPVLSNDGHLQGIVCLEDVRKIPRGAWERTNVAQIMTPTSALSTLSAEAPASDALRKLGERNVDQVPVLERDGSLLGLVRRADILRWLSLHSPHAPA